MTTEERRADAARNRRQILDAARRLLDESPGATMGQIAQAAELGRSTLYRHFGDRDELVQALDEEDGGVANGPPMEPGQLGRTSPLAVEATHIFDAVPPYLLADQLVAEA